VFAWFEAGLALSMPGVSGDRPAGLPVNCASAAWLASERTMIRMDLVMSVSDVYSASM
jgi:hypothetical protein